MASEQPTLGMPAQQPSELTTQIHTTGATDTCSNCQARLAPDQRYCLECGQRRGGERSPFSGLGQPAPAAAAPAGARPAGKRRMTVNGTFIAGIGTLLLAMGVGVLIGRTDTGSSSPSKPAVQVVTVAGAGAASSGASTSTTPTTSTTGSTGSSATKSTNAASSLAAATSDSAAKPGSSQSTPVVKVGGACPQGQTTGCSNGKFTGNFFGSGSGG